MAGSIRSTCHARHEATLFPPPSVLLYSPHLPFPPSPHRVPPHPQVAAIVTTFVGVSFIAYVIRSVMEVIIEANLQVG